MSTLLRRWRILNAAQRVIVFLRVCLLLRVALAVVRTTVMLCKRKGR